jgi:hypothetical protein
LATLLIAMAWSGVVVWLNTRSHVTRPLQQIILPADNLERPDDFMVVNDFGWPWDYTTFIDSYPVSPRSARLRSQSNFENLGWSRWNLAGDAVVGVILVVVLTWASSQLLRRVTSRLRRNRLPPRSTS